MKLLCDFIDINKIRNDVIYLLGVEEFSFNASRVFSVNESLQIIKKLNELNIKVCVNLEKIMFDDDLEKIISYLYELEKLNIEYITYSDLGLYQLIKEENINLNVVYHATTMITNVSDINYLLEENHSVILGKEVSFEELKYIDANLNKKLFIDAFGKFPIFSSRRNLVSTYFEFRKLLDNPKALNYTLIEEFRNDSYNIVEGNGTNVFEPFYYYLDQELNELNNIEGLYLCSNFLTDDEYNSVIDIYLKGVDIEENLSKILSIYKGKLTEKTILVKGGIK